MTRLIDADALKMAFEVAQYNDIDDLVRTEKLIDNAPTVDAIPNEEGYEMYNKGYMSGYENCKKDVIHSIAKQYSEHNELVPSWLHICNMMEVDMTNKEAIYFLKKVIINYGEDTDEWDCCVQAIDLAIKALENEKPQGEWIPISERLPEEEGDYLIQTVYGELDIDHFVTDFMCYKRKVEYWQELPRPYKEVDND